MMKGVTWAPIVRFMYNRFDKWRVEHTVMGLAERFDSLQCTPVRMLDGRVLCLDLRNPVSMPYLMQGDFPCESMETEFVRSVVRPGDTAIDIGANVGWYSTLLADLVGPEGNVWAFEPNNNLVRLLRQLEETTPHLHVEQAGVGDCDGEQCFSIPENWISGSFGKFTDEVETQDVVMYKLDTFLDSHNIEDATFVKCDAEGAELRILKGATRTMTSEKPPMWLLEMSSEETAKFGYHPQRLVEFFKNACGVEYHMFMVNQDSGGLEPLVMPSSEPFWFNTVFVPPWLAGRVKQYL